MELEDISFHQLNPFLEFDQTMRIWQSIEKNAANSFYLSWVWMENWLSCLSSEDKVIFVFGEHKNKPVFCYFLGLKKGVDSKITYCNRAYLNGTGDFNKDAITIEQNGILIDKAFGESNLSSVFQKASTWDELVARFLSPDQIKYFSQGSSHLNLRIEDEDKAFYVDLEQVRNSNNDLLPLLSKNKRSQIRRSIKAYEKVGPIKIEFATNPADAKACFTELQTLLQERQKQKYGEDYPISDFASKFHERLIAKYCARESVDLVTVFAGDCVIGHLYNFIDEEGVYFNQCGFEYRPENVYRPGLVCHLLLINHYASLGYPKYDFMVGEMDYKKSLSSGSYAMPTYRLRKNKIRFKIEDMVRKAKRDLSEYRTK
ncbi:MAG: GNAT family N-acetyltransferase [Pseudomonadales bacterium]|nr:GNAT family N-acetyltransferase [Pseudomonadales bacterium]